MSQVQTNNSSSTQRENAIESALSPPEEHNALVQKRRNLTPEEKQEIRDIDDSDDEFIPWRELDLDNKAIVVTQKVTPNEFAKIHAEVASQCFFLRDAYSLQMSISNSFLFRNRHCICRKVIDVALGLGLLLNCPVRKVLDRYIDTFIQNNLLKLDASFPIVVFRKEKLVVFVQVVNIVLTE